MDAEKVVNGLEKLRKDLGYGLPDRSNVVMEYLDSLTDALTLLKKQKPKKIICIVEFTEGMKTGRCPSCARSLVSLNVDEAKFCKSCGQAVKWDD